MILAQAFARFVFDLDGVIWRGGDAIAGAPDTVRALRDGSKRICFVTNNSSEVHRTYADKLAAIGAGADQSEIVTSADAVRRLIERTVPGARGRLAYVVGGEGLEEAVRAAGMRLASSDDARDASVVVVGWDRELTYEKLKLATLAIRDGAVFIASNTDATYPAPDGFWPGGGAIVSALITSTGRTPQVAGKPDPLMLEVARDVLEGTPALMVGDRVETDVAAAHAYGWPSALVLSGASGVPELAAARLWPQYVLRRLTDLLEDLPHPEVRAASGPDLPHIANMLHAGGLNAGAARERVARTVVAEADRRPIATASWDPADGCAVLRSVAVADDRRRSGAGTIVVAGALRALLNAGITDVFLVTENAEKFFASCGFTVVSRDDVPAAILTHPQIARECSPGAPVMHLKVPATVS